MAVNPKANRTISRRKLRRAHFQAPSHVRRILMSSRLNKDLRAKHGVHALPVRKDDEVKVMTGQYKGKEGKVTACYRLKWVIHIDKVQREKCNGTSVNVGVHPSNVEITKLKITGNRQKIIDRKAKNGAAATKPTKGAAVNASKAMQNVD